MRARRKAFVRGCLFAVLSARQPFDTIPDQLKDVDAKGEASKYLFSWKLPAYRHLMEHGATLHRQVCASQDTVEALHLITRVPGIGIVKGAFVLQMLGHDVACLDTRNIKRDGRDPEAYHTRGPADKNTKAFRAKCERYVADTGGRAQEYWDAWCEQIAGIYKMTPLAVSAMHLAVIPRGLEKLEPVPSPCVIPRQGIPF